MVTLVSPGVAVPVSDETVYGAPGGGTVPLYLIATAQDKLDPTSPRDGDGNPTLVAEYTTKANANKLVRVTSQREMTQFFGDATFTKDGNQVIEGSETSEYGLLAAYSYLGQGSRAFVVRADVDLKELGHRDSAPTGPVASGRYWLDTDGSSYGVHEYDGNSWVFKQVTVEVDVDANGVWQSSAAEVGGTSAFVPSTAGSTGDYLVAVLREEDGASGIALRYFKYGSSSWEAVTGTFGLHTRVPQAASTSVSASGAASSNVVSLTVDSITGFSNGDTVIISGLTNASLNGEYTINAAPSGTTIAITKTSLTSSANDFNGATITRDITGETWIKTTRPDNGVNLAIYRSDSNGTFNLVEVEGVTNQGGSDTYVQQGGGRRAALNRNPMNSSRPITNDMIEGNIALDTETTAGSVLIKVIDDTDSVERTINGEMVNVGGDPVNITSIIFAQDAEPGGDPVSGQLWFDNTKSALDILVHSGSGWNRVVKNNITYAVQKPDSGSDGDIWVDTSAPEREYPKLYKFSNGDYRVHDNTNQTGPMGVVFDNFTTDATVTGSIDTDTALIGRPDYQEYPMGILAVNMALSQNTVREYKTDLELGMDQAAEPVSTSGSGWINAATNNADGSGAFGRLAQRRLVATRMQASVVGNDDLRDENANFTLLSAVGYPELQDELVNLNTDRGETGFIVTDTPLRVTPKDVVTWIGGQNAAENGEDGLPTKHTYSAVYYPHVRTTTPAGDTVTTYASHSALYTYAYNDNVAYPWFAPAGLTRGLVRNGSAVGYITAEEEFKPISLNQGQRDSMYEVKLNPIANFASEGVVIFGQKTLHPFDSALDRVNVARLVAYLRERFEVIARPLLFEPNDQPTRERARALFEGFLADLISKRALEDFAVVCDTSNNTPLRVSRNELWIDVAIIPIRAVEFIYIPIRLVSNLP